MVSHSACYMIYLFTLFSIKSASGLIITSPAQASQIDMSSSMKVDWSTVASDPSQFDIQISNQDPNLYSNGLTKMLKQDVNAADGTTVVTGLENLRPGSGYTLNLIQQKSGAILAQAGPFLLAGSSSPIHQRQQSDSTDSTNVIGGGALQAASDGSNNFSPNDSSFNNLNPSRSIRDNAHNNGVQTLRPRRVFALGLTLLIGFVMSA